jgi:hypothetical protein
MSDLRRPGDKPEYTRTHSPAVIAVGGRRRSCGKCGAHHEYVEGAFKAHPVWKMLGPCCRKDGK